MKIKAEFKTNHFHFALCIIERPAGVYGALQRLESFDIYFAGTRNTFGGEDCRLREEL